MFNFKQHCIILFASVCAYHSTSAQILNIDPKTVEAEAWIVLDPKSQQVIASHNAEQIRAPASLTKMMVGYLTLKAIQDNQLKLDQIITVPDIVKTVASDESRLQLKPQETISVQELLASLIIMSANDAALTLATTISGDVPSFIHQMNKTAHELGMMNTHFSNASGITMENHYTTAFDLSLLAKVIVNNTSQYLGYSKQQEFRRGMIYHEATNILLKKDPSVDGFKTGFTKAAGYNLALTANRLDTTTNEYRRLIVIVMGTASKQKRADVAETLMNISFNYTQTKQLFTRDHLIAKLPLVNSNKTFYDIKLPSNASYNTLSLLDRTQILDAKKFDGLQQRFLIDSEQKLWLEPLKIPMSIEYTIQLNQQQLTAPLHQKNLTLAQVKISQFGQQLNNIEIKEDIDLPEANIWQKVIFWFKHWIAKWQGESNDAVIYQITS